MLDLLLNNIKTGEFDYTILSSCLSKYKKPRNQITKLIKKQLIVRIKKGLYVFGPNSNGPEYSKEILANLIYGPSYISMQYALAYHGLIPEKVFTLTSMTNKRNKVFTTPVGNFTYKYISPRKYSIGITRIKIRENSYVLFASPEKALADILISEKNIDSVSDLNIFLIQNLRIEESNIAKLNLKYLREIQRAYKLPVISHLIKLTEQLR
ncbi:hypothetical protein ACFL2K_00155 [Candidatus Margulisiibacteriota bacterium]